MTNSIVLIDDFPLTIQFIQYHLELAGYKNIESFENPLDALEYIQNGNFPQVIITDFQMPVMNGLEFLERIKSSIGSIPAIITTADPQMLKSGFTLHPVMEKGAPGFIEELLCQIKKVIIKHPAGLAVSTI